jgi:hypothetical protein
MIFVVITGILVFATAYISDIPLLMWVFSKPLGIMAIAFATLPSVDSKSNEPPKTTSCKSFSRFSNRDDPCGGYLSA